MPSDRVDRAADTRVVDRQEADQWDHQETRVEVLRTVCLREGADTLVEPAFADVTMDRLAQDAPFLDRSLAAEAFDRLDRAIDGDPRHHLRMCELLAGATDFPDPLVRILPVALEEAEERLLDAPGV